MAVPRKVAAVVQRQAGRLRKLDPKHAKAIQGISDVTERAATGSEEMAASSEQLGAQAQSLRDLVSRFKTDSGQSGQDWTTKSEERPAQAAAQKDRFSRSTIQKGNGQTGQDWMTQAAEESEAIAV